VAGRTITHYTPTLRSYLQSSRWYPDHRSCSARNTGWQRRPARRTLGTRCPCRWMHAGQSPVHPNAVVKSRVTMERQTVALGDVSRCCIVDARRDPADRRGRCCGGHWVDSSESSLTPLEVTAGNGIAGARSANGRGAVLSRSRGFRGTTAGGVPGNHYPSGP